MKPTYLATITTLFLILSAQATIAAEPVKIWALGDSITYGYGAPGAYRTRLYTNFVNAGMPMQYVGSVSTNPSPTLSAAGQVQHEGWPGRRIDEIAANLTGDSGFAGNKDGHWLDGNSNHPAVYPDYVLLMIGTNDFVQDYQTATAKDRLDSLITDIVTARPEAKLIVGNLIKTTDATLNAKMDAQFNPFIENLVGAHRSRGESVFFVDLNSVVDPSTDLSDRLHPNQQGYDKMGDAWFSAIQAAAVPEPSTAVIVLGVTMGGVLRRQRGNPAQHR